MYFSVTAKHNNNTHTSQAITDAVYKHTTTPKDEQTTSHGIALRALYILEVLKNAPGWSDWRHRENYFVRCERREEYNMHEHCMCKTDVAYKRILLYCTMSTTTRKSLYCAVLTACLMPLRLCAPFPYWKTCESACALGAAHGCMSFWCWMACHCCWRYSYRTCAPSHMHIVAVACIILVPQYY